MFELEYLKIYSGAEISHVLRYASESNEIARYLSSRFDFKKRVNAPQRPGKMATRAMREDYQYELQKYHLYVRSVNESGKFVLDIGRQYVITRNKGTIWLNYKTSKEVSVASYGFFDDMFKSVGCTIKETGELLIIHDRKYYTVNFDEETIRLWEPEHGR